MGTVYARKQTLWVGYKGLDGKMKYHRTDYVVGQEALARKVVADVEEQIANGHLPVLNVEGMTVAEYADRWYRERKARKQFSADNDESRIRVHALPSIGHVKLTELRPKQIRDLVQELSAKIGPGKKQLAPRSVRQVYTTLHTMLNDAVADEFIDVNPAVLKRGQLPKKADKDPLWRGKAVYTHEEVLLLISDPVVPEDRRTLYALLALTGMRFGEVAALRWHDYERKLKPLGKLSVYKSFNVEHHVEKGVKTEQPREVPVHATLATLLEAWWTDGWKRMLGRAPKPEDLIIPSREGRNRNVNKGLTRFHQDLERLGLRRRRQHDLRRTFISLAIGDGARGDVIRWSTHGPRGDIMDMYTTLNWQSRCEETAKLRITLAPAPEPPPPSPTERPWDALQSPTERSRDALRLITNHLSQGAIALHDSACEQATPSPTERLFGTLQLIDNRQSSSAIALQNVVDEADDLLQILLHEVATAVALQQKSPESYGLGADVLQRGGRDLNLTGPFSKKLVSTRSYPQRR